MGEFKDYCKADTTSWLNQPSSGLHVAKQIDEKEITMRLYDVGKSCLSNFHWLESNGPSLKLAHAPI